MEVVVAVKVLRPYVLEVTFADGAVREVDMEGELWGEMFAPLRDPEVVPQASVDADLQTVVWPNGADICPDVLYWGWKVPPWAQEPVRHTDAGAIEAASSRR